MNDGIGFSPNTLTKSVPQELKHKKKKYLKCGKPPVGECNLHVNVDINKTKGYSTNIRDLNNSVASCSPSNKIVGTKSSNVFLRDEEQIGSNKSKYFFNKIEEMTVKEQYQKYNTDTDNRKLNSDKRNKCVPSESKHSVYVIKKLSNIPEVEMNYTEWNKDTKSRGENVTLEKEQVIQNNVDCLPDNINFSSPDNLSKNSQIIKQSGSHLVNFKEETNALAEEKLSTIQEKKYLEACKTREEIVRERRIKVCARKKEKKLANLQQKEECLKKTMAQKYKGITLVKMKEGENINIAKESVSAPELSDFPCLGSSCGKKKPAKKCTSDFMQEIVRRGKPKKLDPISINIFDMINRKKIEQKSVVPVTKLKSNIPVISGNILDSDNPQRKRGKVYLGKKAKPSRLKAYILKVRQEKLRMKNSASTSTNKTKKLTIEEETNYQLLNEASSENAERLDSTREDGLMLDGVKSSSQDGPDNKIVHVLHSRRFREYCDNVLTPALVESVCNLLTAIVKFQDRLYARDPIKAHAKRRYVTGLREARKYLKLGKVKLLIIAPDLEKIPGENGLDAFVFRLKEEAQNKCVPYVFGPNRKKLGHCTFKKQKISSIAILKFEGAEAQFSQVVSLLNEARDKYTALVAQADQQPKADTTAKVNADQSKEIQSEVITSFLEKLRLKDDESLEIKT